MSTRRRRGRRRSRHEAPQPWAPQPKPSNGARAPDAGRARLESDDDKVQAMTLDQTANGRRSKRSFVLSNLSKLSTVAVFHCRTRQDLADLKATLDSLQRTYHPTNDPVLGHAEPPTDREEASPRQPVRAGAAILPRRQGTTPLRGRPLDEDGAIEFAQPTRPAKLIARGTPPPDDELERGHYGRYEQQADYDGEV